MGFPPQQKKVEVEIDGKFALGFAMGPKRCWTWVCVGGFVWLAFRAYLFQWFEDFKRNWNTFLVMMGAQNSESMFCTRLLALKGGRLCAIQLSPHGMNVMFHPTAPILPFNDRHSMRSHFASKVLPMHQQWSLVFLGYRKVHHFPHIFRTWMTCGTTATKKSYLNYDVTAEDVIPKYELINILYRYPWHHNTMKHEGVCFNPSKKGVL